LNIGPVNVRFVSLIKLKTRIINLKPVYGYDNVQYDGLEALDKLKVSMKAKRSILVWVFVDRTQRRCSTDKLIELTT